MAQTAGGKGLMKCAASDDVAALAETLKVLSDVNRLRIMCLLFSGEKCVCEIEEGLDISQPLASHHLKVLLAAGLVEVRKEGTWSYYSLSREAVDAMNRDFEEFLGAGRMGREYPAAAGCDEAAGARRAPAKEKGR